MAIDIKKTCLYEFTEKGSPDQERPFYEMLWRQLDFVKELVPWVFVVQIVYASIQFIASVCLLVGIVKNKAGLMKPWLFLTMFTLLVSHELHSVNISRFSYHSDFT